jgi:uncharacterized RDD family membrane protein YckC
MKKPSLESTMTSGSHRLVALMFDLALMIILAILLLTPSIFVFINALVDSNYWTVSVCFVVALLSGGFVAIAILLYQVALPYYWGGQTLGMRFFKMKYVGESGEPCSVKPLLICSISTLALALLTVGVYFFVEFLTIAGSAGHRSFVDTVARLYVVDTDSEN